MKYIIILIALCSCAKTRHVTLAVTRVNKQVDTVSIKIKRGFCIADFEGDTIPKLIDKREKILLDNVTDYKIISIR